MAGGAGGELAPRCRRAVTAPWSAAWSCRQALLLPWAGQQGLVWPGQSVGGTPIGAHAHGHLCPLAPMPVGTLQDVTVRGTAGSSNRRIRIQAALLPPGGIVRSSHRFPNPNTTEGARPLCPRCSEETTAHSPAPALPAHCHSWTGAHRFCQVRRPHPSTTCAIFYCFKASQRPHLVQEEEVSPRRCGSVDRALASG